MECTTTTVKNTLRTDVTRYVTRFSFREFLNTPNVLYFFPKLFLPLIVMRRALMTISEVCEFLQICRNTLSRFEHDGQLVPVLIGSRKRFVPEDLDAFIQSRKNHYGKIGFANDSQNHSGGHSPNPRAIDYQSLGTQSVILGTGVSQEELEKEVFEIQSEAAVNPISAKSRYQEIYQAKSYGTAVRQIDSSYRFDLGVLQPDQEADIHMYIASWPANEFSGAEKTGPETTRPETTRPETTRPFVSDQAMPQQTMSEQAMSEQASSDSCANKDAAGTAL